MEEQEKMIRLGIIESEAQALEHKIQAIEQQVLELSAARESISALEKGKNKEILANLGKGIFAEAKISSDKLRVNVGKGILLKKSVEETLKIIDEQAEKLSAGREELLERMSEMQEEVRKILSEEKEMMKEKHEHRHSEECRH